MITAISASLCASEVQHVLFIESRTPSLLLTESTYAPWRWTDQARNWLRLRPETDIVKKAHPAGGGAHAPEEGIPPRRASLYFPVCVKMERRTTDNTDGDTDNRADNGLYVCWWCAIIAASVVLFWVSGAGVWQREEGRFA